MWGRTYQRKAEEDPEDHNGDVADVGRHGRGQREERGDEHGVAEDAARAHHLGEAAARQLGEHVAPEEAAQQQVLRVLVPVERRLLDPVSLRAAQRSLHQGAFVSSTRLTSGNE